MLVQVQRHDIIPAMTAPVLLHWPMRKRHFCHHDMHLHRIPARDSGFKGHLGCSVEKKPGNDEEHQKPQAQARPLAHPPFLVNTYSIRAETPLSLKLLDTRSPELPSSMRHPEVLPAPTQAKGCQGNAAKWGSGGLGFRVLDTAPRIPATSCSGSGSGSGASEGFFSGLWLLWFRVEGGMLHSKLSAE